MSTKSELPTAIDEQGKFVYDTVSPEKMLKHHKAVVASMMQDPQNVWAELWRELQDRVVSKSGVVLPQGQNGLTPACGWPEFLETMCALKHHIDHARRLCEEGRR